MKRINKKFHNLKKPKMLIKPVNPSHYHTRLTQ
jgi:hypothetical protein